MGDYDFPPDVAPELYREAADILTKAVGRKATLKTLIYSSQYKKMFQRHKNDIKFAVDKVVTSHKAKSLQEAAQIINQGTTIQIPRYMRVNLIKSSVESVVEDLKLEGWDYVGIIDKDAFSEMIMSFGESQFGLDPMLPDLLVFAVGTDLHDHHLTKTGVLVQQDRASCVPAHVLNPTTGSVVLDCCSAPGNKTSHLASLLRDDGRVIALDRDYKRMLTMSQLLKKSGATCVELIHQDFLTVKPGSDDASDIKFILVDPSCSGSGMLASQMDKQNQRQDTQRIQTLKRFQISILKHALRFPNVERVVYSTCSIHQEENEEVAEEVMAQVSEYFQFHPVFPEWKNSHGISSFPHSEFFLRLKPQRDLTQGFFVACFERVKPKQQNVLDSEKHRDNEVNSGNEYAKDMDMFTSDSMESTSKSKRKVKHEHEKTEDQGTSITAGKNENKKKRRKQKQSTRSNILSETKGDTEFLDADVDLDCGMNLQPSQQVKQKSVDIHVHQNDSMSDNNFRSARADDSDDVQKAERASMSECKKRKYEQSALSHDDGDSTSQFKAKKRKKDKKSSLSKDGHNSLENDEATELPLITKKKIKNNKKRDKSPCTLLGSDDSVLDKAGKAYGSESNERQHKQGTLPLEDTCNSPHFKVKRKKKVKNPSPSKNGDSSLDYGEAPESDACNSFSSKIEKRKKVKGSLQGKNDISSSDNGETQEFSPAPSEKITKGDKSSDTLTDKHHSEQHDVNLGNLSIRKKKKKNLKKIDHR